MLAEFLTWQDFGTMAISLDNIVTLPTPYWEANQVFQKRFGTTGLTLFLLMFSLL